MCTRFIYRGSDIVTAFNFDIDTDVWKHKIILEKRRFCIGILRPDGKYHSYHGVNANGNAGTLLYVHENPKAAYSPSPDCVVISDILEKYIKAELSFDDILGLLHTKRLVYAPDATMQAMLTDALGRALILEPGIGHREEAGRFSLMTNYSLLDPQSTLPYIVPGDSRCERAGALLNKYGDVFTVSDAFHVLKAVKQEGEWATRVSFVYSLGENAVYFTENNDFEHIRKYSFT